MATPVLFFEDESKSAGAFAAAAGLEARQVTRHRFPDRELRLTLPFTEGHIPRSLVVYRSLDRPNEKLVELLLIARHARQQGVQTLILVAPYLAYMRQDIAFNPGEIVSQKIIGAFLAELFDGVVTVDPHLHRIDRLEQAIPISHAVALSGAPILAELVAQHRQRPLLMGPDAESAQWVEAAAARQGFDHGVCSKVRHGDREVEVKLPALDVSGREVVLLDDVASSGRTLARAAEQLLAAGARSVDVAVTHALFADDALEVIGQAGVGEIWSTDCIAHASNAISMAPVLAEAVGKILAGEG
ncbi:MAG: ribose-phosphate diphosphokinase [Marinobacter sp.]|nr:ribose-phosphate diphosphokinase [Marinobacter sp.]